MTSVKIGMNAFVASAPSLGWECPEVEHVQYERQLALSIWTKLTLKYTYAVLLKISDAENKMAIGTTVEKSRLVCEHQLGAGYSL
jgi:hypothetical protein